MSFRWTLHGYSPLPPHRPHRQEQRTPQQLAEPGSSCFEALTRPEVQPPSSDEATPAQEA